MGIGFGRLPETRWWRSAVSSATCLDMMPPLTCAALVDPSWTQGRPVPSRGFLAGLLVDSSSK